MSNGRMRGRLEKTISLRELSRKPSLRCSSLGTKREENTRIINLHQGGMSVKECSLKFTQLSKHAPTMVADSRAKMKKKIGDI